MGSLVAELAEKLSAATNSLDFDEQTMFLNTSANTVGIGTDSPASKLDVRGTVQVGVNDTGHDVTFYGAAAGAMMQWDEDADSLLVRGATADAVGSTGRLVLQTAQVAVADGDILGRVDFQAPLETQGSDGILVSASIWAEADDTFTATVNSTELVFATATDDAVVEHMRIASDGKVGIGTSVPVTDLTIDGPITIKEQADADADTAAYGQIWVNTATPNELYFTTDAGNDIQITSGTALAGAFDSDAAQVFNESGADVDFRIESDDDQYKFFVDGGNDRIGIGTSAPDGPLHVHTATAGSVTASANGDDLVVENSASGGITILAPDASDANLYLGSPSDSIGALVRWNHDADQMTVGTSNAGGKLVLTSADNVTAVTIDAIGTVTMPLQPCFCMHLTNNQTSPANGVTVVWGGERFDNNNDVSSNTFTAPVTGKYIFLVGIRVNSHDQNSYSYLNFVTSNQNYEFSLESTNQWDASANYHPLHASVVADMDASDTCHVTWGFSAGNAPGSLSSSSFWSGGLIAG